MKKHHDDLYVGHFGYEKTFKIIWRKVFWFVMHSNIWQYIKKCKICQRTKVLKWKLYRSLAALSQSIILFREIFLNFIIKLPLSMLDRQVYNSILVMIDHCTQMSLYIFTTETITASVLIELLKRRVFNCFNYSDRIVSDWGSLFINHYYLQLCYWTWIEHWMSTVFHPQMNRQMEKQNQTLKQYL